MVSAFFRKERIIGKYKSSSLYLQKAGINAFLPVIAKRAGISEIYDICLAENAASLADEADHQKNQHERKAQQRTRLRIPDFLHDFSTSHLPRFVPPVCRKPTALRKILT